MAERRRRFDADFRQGAVRLGRETGTLCPAAIVLTSSAGQTSSARCTSAAPPPWGAGPALRYASVAGVSFGLYFLLIRNAAQSGELWPVAAGRIGELAAVLIAAAALLLCSVRLDQRPPCRLCARVG